MILFYLDFLDRQKAEIEMVERVCVTYYYYYYMLYFFSLFSKRRKRKEKVLHGIHGMKRAKEKDKGNMQKEN